MTSPVAPERAASTGGAEVSVVVAVAVHNRRDVTVQWLQSLLASDRAGIDLHLVLVDDGSTDGTAAAVLDVWPTAEVIAADGDQWWAAGTNLAIERALRHDPDFVLVSNDDTIVEVDALQRLVSCAHANPRCVVGPVLVHADDPGRVFQTYPRWQTAYGGWRHREHLRVERLPTEPLEVDVIVGNCILVPAGAIRECGLIDDRGVQNWVGDAEWTPRFARAGWRLLIEPSARVACLPNAVPESPWTGGVRQVFAEITDPVSPYNWRATWTRRVVTAPDPLRGALAFVVHVCRLAARRIRRGTWPAWSDEPVPGPGARRFADGATHSAGVPDVVQVVWAWPYVEWGGAQTHLLGMARHLGDGFHVQALVPRGTDPHLVRLLGEEGIGVAEYGQAIDLGPATTLGAKVRRRANDARAHAQLWRATRRLDPATTVLHVDLGPWSSAALIRMLTSRFVVFQTLHTAPPPLTPLRRILWRVKLELARSRPGYHVVLGNRDAGIGFDRLLGRALGAALTPTAVDMSLAGEAVDSVDRAVERERLGVPDGVPLVVGAGQLIDRKGVDVAIAAIARAKTPSVVLRWFGAGPARDELEALARRLDVDDAVELVDPSHFATRLDYFRAVAAADVYIQPSREEGLPLALVEAMALGAPVVAADVNGIPEVVEDDKTGLLVAVGDADGLARCIDALLGDPAEARCLAEQGTAKVASDHDLAEVGATMGVLYRRALQRARDRAAVGGAR